MDVIGDLARFGAKTPMEVGRARRLGYALMKCKYGPVMPSITTLALNPSTAVPSLRLDALDGLLGRPVLIDQPLLLGRPLGRALLLVPGVGPEEVVHPPERGRVASDEGFVVVVVVVRARPEGDELSQAPGKVVAAVSVDSLCVSRKTMRSVGGLPGLG